MMTHPGKKLNFMGNEIAMFREWDERREMDWGLFSLPAHDAFRHYMQALNELYLKRKALWQMDHTVDGFKWIDFGSSSPCAFGYIRMGKRERMAVLLNFSDQSASVAPVLEGKVHLLLHTDWEPYGGRTRRLANRKLPQVLPPYSGMAYSCAL